MIKHINYSYANTPINEIQTMNKLLCMSKHR